MEINPILSDIQVVVSLYGELLLIIAAAAVLGFVVGRMISRSTYRKNMRSTVSKWESRYARLEDSARRDTDALEDQLHSLGRESKALQANHTALKKSLNKNDRNVQHARAETIELNRQQAETHARLQRVIQQKDLEIIRLGNRLSDQAGTASSAMQGNSDRHHGLDDNNDELTDGELNHADTVAILPEQNDLDETVQMTLDARTLQSLRRASEKGSTEESKQNKVSSEEASTSTAPEPDAASPALDDGTVVLDKNAAAFARRMYKSGANGKTSDKED